MSDSDHNTTKPLKFNFDTYLRKHAPTAPEADEMSLAQLSRQIVHGTNGSWRRPWMGIGTSKIAVSVALMALLTLILLWSRAQNGTGAYQTAAFIDETLGGLYSTEPAQSPTSDWIELADAVGFQ